MAKNCGEKMRKFKFSYDSDNDDLLIYDSSSKSKGSVEMGDIILDYDNNKKLVGVQIMNASVFLKNVSESGQDLLDNLTECSFEVKDQKNMKIVKIILKSNNSCVESVISVPGIESSPALVYT